MCETRARSAITNQLDGTPCGLADPLYYQPQKSSRFAAKLRHDTDKGLISLILPSSHCLRRWTPRPRSLRLTAIADGRGPHRETCYSAAQEDARKAPGAADRPQPNQSKDRAGVSGRRYRAGSANSKGNRKQRKKRKSRACMARAPDLRRCRCNLRLRFLRFPFLASMRYPTRHDPCGKRFRRNRALRAVYRKITAGCGDLPG